MSYICHHHRQMAECRRCLLDATPRMVVLLPPDLSLIDGYRTPSGPSMDFYHLMNAGFLASLIAVIASILYLILAPVA